MTKVTIDRELLERVVKADASNGASSVDLVDGWKAMEQIRAILAAPRQPEGEAKPDRNKAFDACPDSGCDWGSFWQGWKACNADAQRAIAELREECERLRRLNDTRGKVLIGALSETDTERDTLRQQLAERDAEIERLQVFNKSLDYEASERLQDVTEAENEAYTLRQQRDRLAGLLRHASSVLGSHGWDALTHEIDAALAEVEG